MATALPPALHKYAVHSVLYVRVCVCVCVVYVCA